MAGKEDDKKVKKSGKGKDGDKKVANEKKDKDKDKDAKKNKSVKDADKSKSKDLQDNSEKKSKDKSGKFEKKDKPTKSEKPSAAAQQPRQPSKKAAAPATSSDYLAGLDLPPSDEEDEYENGRLDDDEIKAPVIAVSEKDKRKIQVKERKMLEKAAVAKAEALKDDDNVFDVAYEKQGDGADTLSATDIKVHNMTVRAKGKLLLENTTVTIAAGRRYGLVGPNGKGKSTLLRLIARRQIPVPENLDVLLVEQEVVGEDRSALEAVVAADVELMELRAEEEEIQAKLSATTLNDDNFDADEASDRLNEIYERLQEIGSATAEARASKILHGLGFTEVMQKRATNLFSGGWRMRISLARALYIQPTVLLLDEPTNHLDLRAVLWLEEYLMRWKKTLIVVSHDRDFLNSVTTDIIHLHDLKLHYYRGNFAQFEEMYEKRRREVNNEFEKYQKQLKAAKRSGSKANQDKVVNQAKKKQSRKQEQHQDDENKTEVPRQWSDYTVHFEFPTPTELQPPLIQILDVSFKYPGRDDFGLKDLNIGVDMGSRVAIVGPNGAGKTTLMNLLSGDLEPTEGEFRKSQKLRIGRYSQHFVDALQMDDTPVEYLLRRFPEHGLKPEDMRARLGRFGLSGHHHLQPICKLSGGQKARVVFAAISLAVPHILLLDEPTNHLDMQSIDALADAIEEFEGGVIIISHDSRLLSRVCDDEERSEVWVVENGEVTRYDGDFEDYKNELVKEISAELDEDEQQHAQKQQQRKK